jgi:phosphohistidine phosphatase
MKLYLMQHGDALDKEADPSRPLSSRGRRDINRIASFLRRTYVRFHLIGHSGKTRTEQTAAIIASALGCESCMKKMEGLGPKDPVKPWTGRIARMKGDSLLVGHLPFMSRLVSQLVLGDETGDLAEFTPGTLVYLERSKSSTWHMILMIRPEQVAHL